MCTSVEYTIFIHVYLIIVIINGMFIVYVQMYVIDVCYCVVSHVVSFVYAVGCYVGMVYVLQNL